MNMRKPKIESFEILKEAQKLVSDEKAKNSKNINFQLIKQLRAQGKKVDAILMQNNQIAYLIESPIWGLFAADLIKENHLAAGQRYAKDYFRSIKDNISKQNWGDYTSGARTDSREPSERQIEASGRIHNIKRELDRVSRVPKKEVILDKRLKLMVEMLLEEERVLGEILEKTGLSQARFIAKIKEALEVVERCYRLQDEKEV